MKNVRENHLHQITRKIINENQIIVLENLNISGMCFSAASTAR
ncbi:MAG: hypothetical protein WCG45_05635 [bacterium]